MRKRRTVMKRFLAIVLVVVMVLTSQNLSGLVAAAAGDDVVLKTEMETYVSEIELPDNDELFAGYVDKEFYGEISTFGSSARERLSDNGSKEMYDELKSSIEKVSDGSLESTKFSVDYNTTNAKFSYSNTTKADAITAFKADMAKILDALLVDCPYELYWFDKVTGIAYSYGALGNYDDNSTYDTVYVVCPYVYMYVAGNYQPADYDANNPTVDTTLTSATSTAVANAKAIVESYDDLEDYDKLVAYKNRICELVTYDSSAASAGNFSQDNDPWQLIHVFDNDASTNVVCEGYSKAFQYLCDMSTFENPTYSYIVTGTMAGGTGSGGHMWNIVSMENGLNYLVDITNSDTGSIGQNGGLFLAGTSNGNVANGYTFTVSSTNILFKYDSDTTVLWGTGADSILKLAEEDYVYVKPLYQLRFGDVIVVENDVVKSEAVLPEGVSYDHSTKTITLNNANLELGMDSSYVLIEGVGDYKLVLNGTNSIVPVSALEENYVIGIKIDGDLTIEGTGSLTVDVSDITVIEEAFGMDISDNLIINNGTVNVVTGDVGGRINEAICVEGNLIANAGVLNATAGSAAGTEYSHIFAIDVYKNMTVSANAKVNAVAGEAEIYSNGITVGNVLTTQGDIDAKSGAAEAYSMGIEATTISINGGRVISTAREANAGTSAGIRSSYLTIKDAYVDVTGDNCSVMAFESMNIEDSTVVADELYCGYDINYKDSIIISKTSKAVDVYGNAKLVCDLNLENGYVYTYEEGENITLGEYVITYADGGTISDKGLECIADEVAMVTLTDGTNIYYGNLNEALATAGSNSDSILTLLADVNEQITINSGKFTIDMNGYNITAEVDYNYAIVIVSGSEITIRDGSEDKTSVISNAGGENKEGDGIYNAGILHIDGVKCTACNVGVRNESSGTLYITECIIEGENSLANYSDMYIDGSTIAGELVNVDGNMYIAGDIVCTIDSYCMGNIYIIGALTEGASITYNDYDKAFDQVAKPADDYTITESDVAKFTHVYANEGYVFGINSSKNIQVYGDLSKAVMSITPESFTYNGTANIVEEMIMFNDVSLTVDTDYIVEYVDNTNVGEATVTVKGTGNYIGTLTDVFYINAATLTVSGVNVDTKHYDGTVTASVAGVSFEGLASTDVLIEGTDYTITASFADAGVGVDKNVTYTIVLLDTAVAKNYAFAGGARTYTGTVKGVIEKASAPALSIEAQSGEYGAENLTFDVAELVTGIPSDAGAVSYALGAMVPYGWSVSEDGILTISEFTVTAGLVGSVDIVVSTDNYEDTTVRFTVESKARDVSNVANVTLSDIEYEYNGLEQKPAITVVMNGTTLVDGNDYDVTYPSDVVTVGDKEITITFKGNYTGEINDTYKISPKVIYPIVSIKDKQYDGEVDAEIEDIILDGIVLGDDVAVTWDEVTAEFADALEEADKSVILTGKPVLVGTAAGNYQLDMVNLSVTGTIYNNYVAAEDVDYTVNVHGWTNGDIVITAKDGYEIAPVGISMGAWRQEFVVGQEGQYTISFVVRNSEGHISKTVSVDAEIDKTAPTGVIWFLDEINWNTVGNVGAFKLFLNVNKIVEIFGDDSKSEHNSDIAKIEYAVLSDVITNELDLMLISWKSYTDAITLTQNSKQYVYAKITDNAGNYTFIDSQGIVIYTDAEAVTTEVDYTKQSETTVIVSVKLNDNTIKAVYMVDGDNEFVVDDAYYSVSGSNIVLSNEYLDDVLKAGTYTFRVEYNPYGVVYDGANRNNVEPKKTEFTLNISKATGSVEITNATNMNSTFGDSLVNPQYITNSSGEVVVEYKVKGADDSTYSTEKPVNVGNYTVRVTVETNKYYTEAVTTADFTIEKASLSVDAVEKNILRTVATTGNTINVSALLPADKGETSYVATKNSSLLENVGVNENGILSFDTLTSDTEVTETISIEVTMTNYKTTTIVVKVSFVDKEVVTITGVQAATGLIYDGAVKQGYTGIPTSKYTGEYVITYAKNGATISNLADVEPIDAGAYTVTIAVPNDNPYYMGSVTLEFTIGKATPVEDDITITSPLTLKYDGSVKDVVAESANAELGDITVYYYVDGKWTATGPVNAGAYDVAVDIAESNNYKSASKLVIGELQITQKDIAGAVVTLEESDLVYDGTSQAQKLVSVVVDGVTLSANDYEVTGNTGTNAGDYELTITGKGNFKGSVKASWSIAKKSLSIIADEATKVYGEADPEFTYKATGLVDGDSIVVTLKREEGENVGDYSIALNNFKGDNYGMTFTNGMFTITAKDIADAVVTLGDELTYNGKAQTQNIASIEVNGKSLSDSDYQVVGNVGTYAGAYELTVTGKGNYTGTATVDWTIAKKDIVGAVITLDDEIFTYDEAEHTKNVVSVVVDGVTLDVTEYKVTGNVGTNAGAYELTVTITDSENYTGEAKAEWSIAPMEITDIDVTVDEDETFVYDGTEQTKEVLEVVINGEALDESEYEVVGNVQKDSGEHIIVVSLTGNYSGTVEIPWTIKKAASVADVETNVLPKASNEVSGDVERLSDVKLPEGWVWSDEDADITLEHGKEITATAVYVGEDKANYENTTMTVKITRAEKVVDDQPTVDNPYTGDTRNTMLWLYVLVLSGLVAMIIGNKRRSVE